MKEVKIIQNVNKKCTCMLKLLQKCFKMYVDVLHSLTGVLFAVMSTTSASVLTTKPATSTESVVSVAAREQSTSDISNISVVGGVSAGIVLVAVAIALVFVAYRRHKKAKPAKKQRDSKKIGKTDAVSVRGAARAATAASTVTAASAASAADDDYYEYEYSDDDSMISAFDKTPSKAHSTIKH